MAEQRLGTLVEVVNGAAPRLADGSALHHECLHCHLALPIQHFMDRYPKTSREALVTQAAEMVAELVAASSGNKHDLKRLLRLATDAVAECSPQKFAVHERLRAMAARPS